MLRDQGGPQASSAVFFGTAKIGLYIIEGCRLAVLGKFHFYYFLKIPLA
jgi:hypothetical protein